jgi:hypothetical protein
VAKELDYEKVKKSLSFLVERYVPCELLTPKAHPIRVLERMEKQHMAMARRGIIIAIGDMIEATQDLSKRELHAADSEMQKVDAYTLSFLQSQLARRSSK